jgi:hypothetical protein
MRSHPSTFGCAGYCLILVLAAGYPCEASSVGDDQCIACHERGVVSPGRARSRFIDPARLTDSVHARRGISCTSCHEGITSTAVGKRVPHRLGIELNCSKCHPKENQEYKNSRHAEISKKKCCCCHDPHYSIPFHRLSQQDRQKI